MGLSFDGFNEPFESNLFRFRGEYSISGPEVLLNKINPNPFRIQALGY